MPLRFAEPASEAHDYQLTIGQLLRTAIDARSDELIVGSDGRRHGYAELEARIGRLANALAACGVREGDVVAVMDWDSHRYLEAYLAVPMMGAVLQTVNVRLSFDQVAYTLASTDTTTLLFHSDFTPLVEQLCAALPQIAVRIPLQDAAGEVPAIATEPDYESLLDGHAPSFPFVEFDERALATTFHTTGTTGRPKAVAFSHRQLVLHTLAAAAALANQPTGQGLRRSDVYMPITPMFHVHAWGLPYVATMLGLKQVYPGRYIPERLVELKETEGVTFSHGVPTILQMIVDALGSKRVERWTMVVGGSALTAALVEAAAARGITALAGYGMSETAPIVSLARHDEDDPRDPVDVRRQAGRLIPLVQRRVVDPDMQDVPEGTQGELVLRTPWLTASYANDARASAALWRGGWMHTQDVVRIAPEGDIFICDRIKDVIKTGGEWVSSADMENLAVGHPAIAAAAFIGVPDPRWGERPVAFAVPVPGATLSLDDLRDYLVRFVERGMISRYALPDRLLQIEELPRTSVGKIDKMALRRLFEAESSEG